jgi:hypothetical protein
LNQIVQRAADPVCVLLVHGEEMKPAAVGVGTRNLLEVQNLSHEQKHHEATITVDRR